MLQPAPVGYQPAGDQRHDLEAERRVLEIQLLEWRDGPYPAAPPRGRGQCLRHSPADTLALLPWAREEVFSFVLFYKQGVDAQAQRAVGVWTRELIDAALRHEGRYYLPYQLHVTREQFERAYPEVVQLQQLKARVDPQGRFSNSLWQKYL